VHTLVGEAHVGRPRLLRPRNVEAEHGAGVGPAAHKDDAVEARGVCGRRQGGAEVDARGTVAGLPQLRAGSGR
jgi:hypothetical protein